MAPAALLDLTEIRGFGEQTVATVAVAVSVMAGAALPVSALSGIGCASAGSPAPRVFGGVLSGALALALVFFTPPDSGNSAR